MKVIMALRSRGLLTEQQVVTAFRFSKAPQEFRLAPTLYRTLHDVIVKEVPLEQLEKARGWAARSAKVLVSQLLYAIEECDGMVVDHAREVESEAIDYLAGRNESEIARLMKFADLSRSQARLLLVLKNSRDQVIDKDTLFRRVYFDVNEADWPARKIVDVYVCKLRKKLPPHWIIETVHSIGYKLTIQPVEDADIDQIRDYVRHTRDGVSMREIASERFVQPSTIMRRIRRIEDRRDDPGFDKLVRDVEANEPRVEPAN